MILAVGVVSILAGVLYTGGPRPYGYAGLGELFVFLFFGLVAVNGSYYVQVEELAWAPFGLSVSIGAIATAIIVVNNIRDIDTDRRAGKNTLAVRLGRERMRVLYVALLGARLRGAARRRTGQRRVALGRVRVPLAAARAVCGEAGPDPHRRAVAERRARQHRDAARGVRGPGLGWTAGRSLMKPERLELVPYSLRFREPYVTSRGQLTERPLLLVRLHDESGAIGLGEAAPLALRGGPDVAEIERELNEHCWPLLEGAAIRESAEGIARALAACRGRGASLQAISALDIALHDLAAKIASRPLWRVLGGKQLEPVLCNATLPAANPSRLTRIAHEWEERGFQTFKLKVGVPGDVQQVARVRGVLGDEALIRVDANAAWRVPDAVEHLRAMAPHRLEIVEQPAPDLEDLAEVRRLTGLRIAADESVVEAEDARRAVKLGAAQIATVKLAKSGGLLAAREIAAQIPIYLSSALDGPVGIAAAAHLAQTIPHADAAQGLATTELFADTIAARESGLNGPRLSVPEGDGLGVEIDPERLEHRRL